MVSEVGHKEDVAANMYLRHIYMRHSHTPSTKCRIFLRTSLSRSFDVNSEDLFYISLIGDKNHNYPRAFIETTEVQEKNRLVVKNDQ